MDCPVAVEYRFSLERGMVYGLLTRFDIATETACAQQSETHPYTSYYRDAEA